MQKDFMSMAQQPQQPMEDDIMSPISDEELTQSGLPTGNDEAAIKGRIMALLDKFGVLQSVSDAQKQKLEQEATKLAKAILAKDTEAIEASPLNDIFEKIVDEENAQLEPSEEDLAEMEAPTQDFASMMPGGGMGGR